MPRILPGLVLLSSAIAAAAACGALWFARETRATAQDAARQSAALLRPLLSLDAPAGATGLRIVNAGSSPAVIRHVALALPSADGSVDWLAYPDPANGQELDLWRFLGLRDAVETLPPDQRPGFAPPPPETVLRAGGGLDLLAFPTTLPAEWRAANLTAADRALNGLAACITYSGLDGGLHQYDLRGLCTRKATPADRQFTGAPPASGSAPAP